MNAKVAVARCFMADVSLVHILHSAALTNISILGKATSYDDRILEGMGGGLKPNLKSGGVKGFNRVLIGLF